MLTDTLCTRCGLCCDGTLFGDVELTGRREATRLELLGLDVDGDDADAELLALPCAGSAARDAASTRSGRSAAGRSSAGCCRTPSAAPSRSSRHSKPSPVPARKCSA